MSNRAEDRGVRRWLREHLGAGSPPAQPPGQPQTLPPPPPAGADTAGLEKQIVRLGREQLKVNSLLELQQQQTQAALQQLREQLDQRERELAALRAGRDAERAEARLQLAERLLPVLDGLDEAVATGERMLQRLPASGEGDDGLTQQAPHPLPKAVTAGVMALVLPAVIAGRLAGRARPERREKEGPAAAAGRGDGARREGAWRDTCAAWLAGLRMVRQRWLETLALEGVRPIPAIGERFDPHQHVALEAVPCRDDAPPGTIVAEARRGYLAGERVLRYAEVTVTRADLL